MLRLIPKTFQWGENFAYGALNGAVSSPMDLQSCGEREDLGRIRVSKPE